MALKNTKYRFGSITKFFHWFMAALIMFMLISGIYVAQFSDPGLFRFLALVWHKNIGVVILILVIMRYIARIMQQSPALPPSPIGFARTIHWLSLCVHYAIYALMVAQPITGILTSSAAGVPINVMKLFIIPVLITPSEQSFLLFKLIHSYCAYGLIGLLFVHICGALTHQFIHKDYVLKRMLPFVKVDIPEERAEEIEQNNTIERN